MTQLDSAVIGRDSQELRERHPEYFEAVRRQYRRNFLLVVVDSSIFSFVISLLSQDTIMPYFVDQLTGRSWLVGLVPAVFYLGYFLPQLIGAFLLTGRQVRKGYILRMAISQRVGIVIIALVAQFLGLLTPPVALGLFFFAYLLFSVFDGLIIPGYSDFISKSIVYNRGMFFGIMNGVGGVTGFLASLLARRWLDEYAFPENVRIIFWTALLVSTISPFFIASFREVPFPVARKPQPLGEFFRSIPLHMRSRPGFRRFLISRACLGLGIMGNAFYALYAINRFDLTPGVLGIFTMIILLTQSIAGFTWGWLGDRFGYQLVYQVASGLVIGMGLLASFSYAAWAFYIVAFGIGGIYAVFNVADANMIYELAPPAETSRFIGISNTFVAPVMTVSPLIGGLLVDQFGHGVLFGVIIGVGLVSAALSLFMMPRPRRARVRAAN